MGQIFFLHIPKAAGTTLIQIINQIYKRSSRFFYDTTKPEICINELNNFSKRKKDTIKIVSGHYSFGFHNYFEKKDFKYFTILRDPIERVISHYYYSSSKTNHYLYKLRKQKEISLSEYIQSGICNEVNNGMSKQIAGLYVNENFGYYDINKQQINDQELFSKAMENIKNHFLFVGFLEEFDKSLFLLKNYIKSPKINFKYTEKNKAKQKAKTISKVEKDIIIANNQVDIKLYNECKKMFDTYFQNIDIFNQINFHPNKIEYYFLKTKRFINRWI